MTGDPITITIDESAFLAVGTGGPGQGPLHRTQLHPDTEALLDRADQISGPQRWSGLLTSAGEGHHLVG